MKIAVLYEYFLNDPLRLLYLTGGTGGIWYWMGQWRDRTRVRIKIIEESRYVNLPIKLRRSASTPLSHQGGCEGDRYCSAVRL